MSVLSTLQHVFPTPKYITFPNMGVDISDTSLKYIQFERKHSRDTHLFLKHWGDIAIPEGVIERGTVHDVERLTKVLEQVKDVTKTEYVRLSLPEERAYLFETTLKCGTPFEEIRGLIEFKLEENVPLSPRDAYFDYDILLGCKDHSDIRVVVSVYAKSTINDYFSVCQRAGLIPLSFEIEAQAIGRVTAAAHSDGTYLIVDFGKMRTGVGIVHKGTLMYTSTIDIGGNQLSAALREELGDMEEKECTEIKNTKGLECADSDKRVYKALHSKIEEIATELETRIHYWHTRDVERGARDIEKVILCGGSSNLVGLPEHFSKILNIPTEQAQVWRNAFTLDSFIPPITRKYSLGYATAIGLALSDFIEPHHD